MRIGLPVIPQGVVVYHGPSMINGQEVVAIATGISEKSENSKTGAVIQTHILSATTSPVVAIKNGADESVCGDCPHRVVNGAGTCYVNVGHAPLNVFKAWIRGSYQAIPAQEASKIIEGRIVRLGAYGDPVAVPLAIWHQLLSRAANWLGYTHQWRRSIAKGFQVYCMASVETERAMRAAQARGWRTFRIRDSIESPLLKGEFSCPASEEQGKRLTCAQCRACDGGPPPKASVAIVAHGKSRRRAAHAVRMLRQKKRLVV